MYYTMPGMNAIGVSFSNATKIITYALNGNIIGTVGPIGGTYIKPTTTDAYYIGRSKTGGYPTLGFGFIYVIQYDNYVASNADLVTTTATFNTGRPGYVAAAVGNQTLDFAAARVFGNIEGGLAVIPQYNGARLYTMFVTSGTLCKISTI
jgi:hypothetical protein